MKVGFNFIIGSVFIGALMFFVGLYNPYLLLPALIGIVNGWINSNPAKKRTVGSLWHTLQLIILVIVLGVLLWTNLVELRETLWIVSLYYLTFEVSRNLFVSQRWNYVGKTSDIDKGVRSFIFWIMNLNLLRKKDKKLRYPSEGIISNFFIIVKFF